MPWTNHSWPWHLPASWSHTPGSGCSQASSYGSAVLRCGSCSAASRRGWTQAAPRSVCAFSLTFGSRSVEDSWFDRRGTGASPASERRSVQQCILVSGYGKVFRECFLIFECWNRDMNYIDVHSCLSSNSQLHFGPWKQNPSINMNNYQWVSFLPSPIALGKKELAYPGQRASFLRIGPSDTA